MYNSVIEILRLCPCPLALVALFVVLILYGERFRILNHKISKLEKRIDDLYKLLVEMSNRLP